MSIELVIVGAGGFGRETLDVVAAINASPRGGYYEIFNVLDDGSTHANLGRAGKRRQWPNQHLCSDHRAVRQPTQPNAEWGEIFAVHSVGQPKVLTEFINALSRSGALSRGHDR